ncbi:hypothetical protein Tsubulata_037865, partial [Turnera subulata]
NTKLLRQELEEKKQRWSKVVREAGAFVPPSNKTLVQFLHASFPKKHQQLLLPYYQHLRKSLGFEDVPDLDAHRLPYILIRRSPKKHTSIVKECARFATFMLGKVTGKKHYLVDVTGANCYCSFGRLFFVTFLAKNSATHQCDTFQAVLLWFKGIDRICYLRMKPKHQSGT